MGGKSRMSTEQIEQQEAVSIPPMGIRMIAREFKKDQLAMFSLTVLIIILLFAFIGAMILDQNVITKINILDRFARPGDISMTGHKYLLGTDEGGRDIFGLLVFGARNSIFIGFSITIITSIIGVFIGLIAGYYGGIIDSIIMRIVDFIMILPIMLIIIVLVTIVLRYNALTLVWIMSAFYWVGKARLFRAKTLSESRRDYISASKTLGSSDFKIIFRELLPNISSLIITNLTMNFGLPSKTPSLGTLTAYANNSETLANRPWIWVPASLLILVLMLSINYVGQALKRSADARQRLG
jgi:peptide/nickel transport system permease protein